MGGNTLTAATLASREDFALGSAVVQPSLLVVSGPSGTVSTEPRVMRVLAALADARGHVISREELREQCWDGRIVGDDAINRAVAEVRRIAQQSGADFAVETVPRVGYRLTGVAWDEPADNEAKNVDAGFVPASRRKLLVAAGATALALTAGAAAFLLYRDSEIDEMIDRGRTLQATGDQAGRLKAAGMFRRALARDDQRADAWGWLAAVTDDMHAARDAAERALALDPQEPNARAVLAIQQLDLDQWIRWEDALLGVLADDPGNVLSLSYLAFFYQGMGRCRDSWAMNERMVRREPFNLTSMHRRALKNWIFGRVGEADKIVDRGMQLLPRNGNMWNARMIIYAFTGRAEAGLALLDDVASRPANLTAPSIASWRAALQAIGSRSGRDIQHAIDVFIQVAPLATGLAANAVMLCSYLGEVDAAYRFAEGLFGNRGPLVQRARGTGINDVYSSTLWGRTQFLFIPATTAFRADPRFGGLCRQMGHVAYWRARGIWPDPFVRGSLDPSKFV